MKYKGIIVPLLLLLVLAFPATGAFSEPAGEPAESGKEFVLYQDVPANSTYFKFINYLTQKDLVKGFPDGTYRPEAPLTRGEAAAMLARVAGLVTTSNSPRFTDVDTRHWAAGVIEAAAEAGLISGYPDGTFRPNNILTRAEAVALFLRLSEGPETRANLPNLQDVPPQHWAARPVAIALASGMVGLSQDGRHFYPDSPFTRGELARALGILLTREPALNKTELPIKLEVTGGTVTVINNDDEYEYKKGKSTNLEPGYSIITGDASSASIVFPDGSGLYLDDNTSLVINDARGRSYIKTDGSPGTGVDWLDLKISRGTMFGALATKYAKDGNKNNQSIASDNTVLLAMASDTELARVLLAGQSGNTNDKTLPWWQVAQDKRVRVKVDMPWGVAAIRGTFWINKVEDSGRSSTTVLTGEAEVTSAGETVTLAAGQRTEISSETTPPEKPAPMNNQDKEEWLKVKDWAVERARDIENNQESEITPPPPAGSPEQPAPLPQQPETEEVPDITDVIEDTLDDAEQDVTASRSGDSDDGDNTPPEFESGYPAVVETGENHVTMQYKMNEPGTIYWVDLTVSDGVYKPASPSEIKSWALTIQGEYNAELPQVSDMWGGYLNYESGVEELRRGYKLGGLDYYSYVVGQDRSGNFSEIKVVDYSTMPDVSPPKFIEGYPRVDAISPYGIDLLYSINELATMHYVGFSVTDVVYYEIHPEGPEQIKDWALAAKYDDEENLPVPENKMFAGNVDLKPKVSKVEIDYLNPGTEYVIYATAEDETGKFTDTIETIEFITAIDEERPFFHTGYPKVTDRGENHVTMQYMMNEIGTIYWVDLTVGDSVYKPSSPQEVKSWALTIQGKDDADLPPVSDMWGGYSYYKGELKEIQRDYKIGGTGYYSYVIGEDRSGNLSPIYEIYYETMKDTTPPEFVDGYPEFVQFDLESTEFYVLLNELGYVYYVAYMEDSEYTVPQDPKDIKEWSLNYEGYDIPWSGHSPVGDEPQLCKLVDLISNKNMIVYITAEDCSPLPDGPNFMDIKILRFTTP